MKIQWHTNVIISRKSIYYSKQQSYVYGIDIQNTSKQMMDIFGSYEDCVIAMTLSSIECICLPIFWCH